MIASNSAQRWSLGWACPSPDDMTHEELVELLDAVAGAGYVGIEAMIDARYRIDDKLLHRELQQRELRLIGVRTGGLIVRHGHSLSHPDPERRRRAVSALCDVIRSSGRFGHPKILLGMMQGKLEDGVTLADAEEWIVEGLAKAAEVAAPLGMEIDLEPINRYLLGYHATVDSILPIIERIGAPNLHLLLDCYHMHLEEVSVAGAIVRAGNTIGHVHVADSNRHAPGGGHFAFAEFFGALSAVGYRGDVTVECDYWPDQITALRSAARYLTTWFD